METYLTLEYDEVGTPDVPAERFLRGYTDAATGCSTRSRFGTTLRVAESFRFDGEVVVTWEGDDYPDRDGNYGYGFDHSYCLVFENER